ncbi:hypothetical protein [Mycolicibacterium mageritense]|uniref:hypothetical protein n=1 Tax=Mycolicibacterium mageritense TaxID=53462 RepID=UPI0011DAC5E7|nr:hypothetical protein [Mycolicibacterium mageritense]TXI60675.1 MAG: hypothetical protein E6Q55_19005 [Mycolicibacterium mageritense]
MLIIALVLAVIGLAALVTAVVTSNELIAWVCIGASVIGVILLIVDALRERSRGASAGQSAASVSDSGEAEAVDYPDEEEPEVPAGSGVSDDTAEIPREDHDDEALGEPTADDTSDGDESAEVSDDAADDQKNEQKN